MLHNPPVRQRAPTLSILHAQVEPAGFNRETTRVRYHTQLYMRTYGYHSQVIPNATISFISSYIQSSNASLSFDRIKLRLDEYRTMLASNSDTTEFATENGRTVISRKQDLEWAKILLQGAIQSRETDALVVLYRLRDLSKVLDNLKLYDECRLAGDMALKLAEALRRQSIEFRNEQAETLAVIAELSVYQTCARTLFIHAVSTLKDVVKCDASDSNKIKYLSVLDRAGSWASGHPDLCVRWLRCAVHLMKSLPKEEVTHRFRICIYNNYGRGLYYLREYVSSIEAHKKATPTPRTKDDQAMYTNDLTTILANSGGSPDALQSYDCAITNFEAALGICRAMSAQDPWQYNELLAKILDNYARALGASDRVTEAALQEKEAVSLLCELVRGGLDLSEDLGMCLERYAKYCRQLRWYAEAVSAHEKSIPILRARLASDPRKKKCLVVAIHNMANFLHTIKRHTAADAAAAEALQMDQEVVLETCYLAPNFKLCFVCQRTIALPVIPPKVSHRR